jgi:hypothetical protein
LEEVDVSEDEDNKVEGCVKSGKFIIKSEIVVILSCSTVLVMALVQVGLNGGGGTGRSVSCSPLRVFDRVVTGIDEWTMLESRE